MSDHHHGNSLKADEREKRWAERGGKVMGVGFKETRGAHDEDEKRMRIKKDSDLPSVCSYSRIYS